MTTVPGAQPVPSIRQAAIELMNQRAVVAICVRTAHGEVLIYRQDVSESDWIARKVLRALGGEA